MSLFDHKLFVVNLKPTHRSDTCINLIKRNGGTITNDVSNGSEIVVTDYENMDCYHSENVVDFNYIDECLDRKQL